MTLLLTLLVALVIIGLIYWVVHRLASAFGIPEPIVGIIDVVLVVIFVLFLLNTLLRFMGRGGIAFP